MKNMITEDYISFEIAKLLKSKNFNIPTRSHYDGRGGFGFCDICEVDWNNYKCFKERRCYSAPTLQMTMKWLRNMYELYIEVSLSCDRKDKNTKIFDVSIFNIQNQRYKKLGNIQGYENACEMAIKYCLENLIE